MKSDSLSKIIQKKVDSDSELLDFSINKKSGKESNYNSLSAKSININNADIANLSKLPGIGKKTAEKIIALRKKRGKFKSIKEIMDVRGIGKMKFEKIKKFIFIE